MCTTIGITYTKFSSFYSFVSYCVYVYTENLYAQDTSRCISKSLKYVNTWP